MKHRSDSIFFFIFFCAPHIELSGVTLFVRVPPFFMCVWLWFLLLCCVSIPLLRYLQFVFQDVHSVVSVTRFRYWFSPLFIKPAVGKAIGKA